MTMMTVEALQKAGQSLLSSEKTDVPLLDQVIPFSMHLQISVFAFRFGGLKYKKVNFRLLK